MPETHEVAYVLNKLSWMEERGIWPNGLRYLWTDAFGLVLLVSLAAALDDKKYIGKAEWLVAEVQRILGRPRGIRIGEEADRDGQYFHYLAMWLYGLAVLSRRIPSYRRMGFELVHQIHEPFVVPGRGVFWKMEEDLSGPYPGFGFGALDAYDGFVSYCLLGEKELSGEIADMRTIIDDQNDNLVITQDLGLGMMLWMTHFFPEESWAVVQRQRCLQLLARMWMSDSYFCREPYLPNTKFAFTNYGVSIGLQAVGKMPEKVSRLNAYFEGYRSRDEYDEAAITHVMACCSHFPGMLI